MKHKNYITIEHEAFAGSLFPPGMLLVDNGRGAYVGRGADGQRYEVSYELMADPVMAEYVREVEE